MTSTEILATFKENIKNELEKKRLSRRERMQLEFMQLTLIYLEDDHSKVKEMWPFFQAGKWVGGILIGANVLYLFNLLVK